MYANTNTHRVRIHNGKGYTLNIACIRMIFYVKTGINAFSAIDDMPDR